MTQPNKILKDGTRPAVHPVKDGASGAVATTIAQGVAYAIVGNNPEMAPFAMAITSGIAGLLGGLGNWGRTQGGAYKAFFGWLG